MSRLLLSVALLSVLFGSNPVVRAEESADSRPVRNDSWRYDAVGRLVQNNKGKNKNSPPYVLVDKTGKPRCYISPDAGLDVANLVNKRVGVRGSVKAIDGDPLPLIVARGVRAVADPAASGGTPSEVVAAGHVEKAAASEELPTPAPISRPAATRAPEEISGPAVGGVIEGEVIEGGQMTVPHGGPEYPEEPGPFAHGHEDIAGGCAEECEGGYCDHECCSARPCGRCVSCCMANDYGIWWVRAEYLAWATKGMRIPPLVTTGPNGDPDDPEFNPGFLGVDGTEILFGDETINNDIRNGGRISFGRWLDRCQTWGIGGEYFALEDERTNFFAASDEDGNPIISRPYFAVVAIDENGDIAPAVQAVQNVALPDILAGSVEVNTSTAFQGAGAYLRYNICCKNMCWPSCCACFDPCNRSCGEPGGLRVGVLGGYRFYKLRDNVTITEDLTSLLEEPDQGDFFVQDRFDSQNKFDGAEVGFVLDARKSRWTLEFMGRIAIGSNKQTVEIDGVTINSNSENDGEFEGGLLALDTNIGTYDRSTFTVIPQLNANLGYNLTCNLKVIAGYTLIYWSSVARAGEQIDLDVNETHIPNAPIDPEGIERPEFVWRNSDFWAHGLNLGLDYRF